MLIAPRAGIGALVVAAIAACTPVGTSPRAASPPGDTVRFSLSADPATLDPLFAHADAGGVEAELARLVFEPFLDLDARGNLVPVLLARIPTVANGDLSPDGRTIIYHLRRNVRWQDGAPVTARDVVFTLAAIRDPRNPVRSREGYDRIASVAALDSATVRVRLRTPWAPAVTTILSEGTAPQYVLPAHLLAGHADLARDAFGEHPVGDGPFRLVRWRRGEGLRYDANPRYWRGKPGVAHLDVRIVPDPNTNLTLLRSGELDWNLIAPAQRPALAGQRDLRFVTEPLDLVAGIALNTTRPPLDDVRVRRAIAASIDRAGISRKITGGLYRPIDTAQPLGSWARDPAARLPAYDPLAAEELLDAAGWRRGPDGIRHKAGRALALTYVQFPETTTGVRVATVVQSELDLRGFAIALKSISNAQLFLPASQGGILASGAFDLAYVPWPMGVDPDDRFLLGCNGIANYARYCDPVVERLEDDALATPDRRRRRTDYAAIERRVAAAVPDVYLFDPAYLYAVTSRLRGFAPSAVSPTWNAAAWSLRSP